MYFGVKLGADEQSCKIVMDPHVSKSSKKDFKGNLILSRDLGSSVLKMNTESDVRGSSV